MTLIADKWDDDRTISIWDCEIEEEERIPSSRDITHADRAVLGWLLGAEGSGSDLLSDFMHLQRVKVRTGMRCAIE